MASIKLITRRIKSVQNISQITKAMEMVAASKMKKAQEAALMGKPYADRIYQATCELARRTGKKFHPLLSEGNPKGKLLIILISTNKGLCGGLNTNLFRMIHNLTGVNNLTEYITIGKKGENFVARTGKKLIADFSLKTPFITSVPAVTGMVIESFMKGEYREIWLAYNGFLSALKQLPLKKRILPLTDIELKEDSQEDINFSDFVMEPSIDDILDNLLPHYIENQIRSAIFEAEASEHSARMIAMKNASDAALDLIDDLTLIYNKARQEKITYEIADIVTARLAVE